MASKAVGRSPGGSRVGAIKAERDLINRPLERLSSSAGAMPSKAQISAVTGASHGTAEVFADALARTMNAFADGAGKMRLRTDDLDVAVRAAVDELAASDHSAAATGKDFLTALDQTDTVLGNRGTTPPGAVSTPPPASSPPARRGLRG